MSKPRLRILEGALASFFGAPRRKRAPLPQYDVKGDDGRWRPVDRIGRKFQAQVAPGTTACWDSLRQARSEGYTLRRRP